jgi:hypothetical protein
MEIPVEPLILPILAVCFACVCVLCGWRIAKLVLWDCGLDLLPLPRCIRRVLWCCGVSCITCPYVVRDCGNHDTFTLDHEHTLDGISEVSGETFTL